MCCTHTYCAVYEISCNNNNVFIRKGNMSSFDSVCLIRNYFLIVFIYAVMISEVLDSRLCFLLNIILCSLPWNWTAQWLCTYRLYQNKYPAVCPYFEHHLLVHFCIPLSFYTSISAYAVSKVQWTCVFFLHWNIHVRAEYWVNIATGGLVLVSGKARMDKLIIIADSVMLSQKKLVYEK